MEPDKKKRSENFSLQEKEILRQLIADSAKIIEDKSNKSSINIKKVQEWKNISKKFSEMTGKERTIHALKLAWKRMKLSAKSNMSRYRQETYKTGRGSKPPSPSAEDLAVMAITPDDFQVEYNHYDSDAPQQFTAEVSHPGPSQKQIFSVVPPAPENIPGTSQQYIVIPEPSLDDRVINVETLNPTCEVTVVEEPNISDVRATEAPKNMKRKMITKTKTLKSNDDYRLKIVESNSVLKRRQIEIMEVEHELNVKIAKLKIKKLELEIEILKKEKQ